MGIYMYVLLSIVWHTQAVIATCNGKQLVHEVHTCCCFITQLVMTTSCTPAVYVHVHAGTQWLHVILMDWVIMGD